MDEPWTILAKLHESITHIGGEDITQKYDEKIERERERRGDTTVEERSEGKYQKPNAYIVVKKELSTPEHEYFYRGRPPFIIFKVDVCEIHQEDDAPQSYMIVVSRFNGYGDQENHQKWVRRMMTHSGYMADVAETETSKKRKTKRGRDLSATLKTMIQKEEAAYLAKLTSDEKKVYLAKQAQEAAEHAEQMALRNKRLREANELGRQQRIEAGNAWCE